MKFVSKCFVLFLCQWRFGVCVEAGRLSILRSAIKMGFNSPERPSVRVNCQHLKQMYITSILAVHWLQRSPQLQELLSPFFNGIVPAGLVVTFTNVRVKIFQNGKAFQDLYICTDIIIHALLIGVWGFECLSLSLSLYICIYLFVL